MEYYVKSSTLLYKKTKVIVNLSVASVPEHVHVQYTTHSVGVFCFVRVRNYLGLYFLWLYFL
jgi:hypothetical protein